MSLRSTGSFASPQLRLVATLFTVYVLWATSYLAIKHVVQVFPPLLMSGLRSLLAAAVLYGWLRWDGQTFEVRPAMADLNRPWRAAKP